MQPLGARGARQEKNNKLNDQFLWKKAVTLIFWYKIYTRISKILLLLVIFERNENMGKSHFLKERKNNSSCNISLTFSINMSLSQKVRTLHKLRKSTHSSCRGAIPVVVLGNDRIRNCCLA